MSYRRSYLPWSTSHKPIYKQLLSGQEQGGECFSFTTNLYYFVMKSSTNTRLVIKGSSMEAKFPMCLSCNPWYDYWIVYHNQSEVEITVPGSLEADGPQFSLSIAHKLGARLIPEVVTARLQARMSNAWIVTRLPVTQGESTVVADDYVCHSCLSKRYSSQSGSMLKIDLP